VTAVVVGSGALFGVLEIRILRLNIIEVERSGASIGNAAISSEGCDNISSECPNAAAATAREPSSRSARDSLEPKPTAVERRTGRKTPATGSTVVSTRLPELLASCATTLLGAIPGTCEITLPWLRIIAASGIAPNVIDEPRPQPARRVPQSDLESGVSFRR